MAATQPDRGATTRAELLAAAEQVIAERGYENATLGEIAETARVTKGALYHHFESKDELLLALLDSRFQQHVEKTQRILASGTAVPGTRLVEEVPFDRRWNLLYLEFVIRAVRDADFRREFLKRQRTLRGEMAAGIEQYMEREGLDSDLSADELATVFAAIGNGLAINALLDPRGGARRLHGATLDLLTAGARARAAR